MVKVKDAVTESTTSPKSLVGYQEIFHMFFDIKIGENGRRKARLVIGGHKKKAPS